MGNPARRVATYEDVLAAPPDVIAQLIGGELHLQSRPAMPHGVAASGLGLDLGNPFQRGRGGPGGWFFVDEPELHLGADVVVPDLAGWRVNRLPELETAFVTVVPDWICEVLSPSSAKLDRGTKADLYARTGVAFYWLVDPAETLVEAFRLVDEAWLRLGAWSGDAKARILPFDAIELELQPLWVKKSASP